MHWSLEDRHFLVFVKNGYDVNLQLIWDVNVFAQKIRHLQEKVWATPDVIDEFFVKACVVLNLTEMQRIELRKYVNTAN